MANGSLLNRSKARERLLERAQELRPTWGPTRVGEDALEYLEERIEQVIDGMIRTHPSIGKTIKRP